MPPTPIPLRGEEWGVWAKILDFCFVLTYVYLLEMGDQNLFTELKNLSPFPRTDVAKWGSTRKISGISIEKSEKIDFFLTVFKVFRNDFLT